MSTDAPAFCAWQNQPALPEGRAYPALAATETQVYVLGGYRFDSATNQVTYYDSVVRSAVQTNGALSPWTQEASFQTGRSGASATHANDCLFISGGSSSTPTSLAYYDDVQFARVQAGGKLSNWTTSPNRLNVARSNHTLLAVTTAQGVFLNAVGGVTQIGHDTVHLDTVEVAKVAADCTIGPWSLANYHLKGGRSTPQAIAVANGIAVIGGWGDLDTLDVYADVQVSTPRADGSPSPWRVTAAELPTGVYGHSTVVATPEKSSDSTFIAIIGGQPGAGAYSNWIAYAYVFPTLSLPEAIGTWRIAPTGRLPSGRAGLSGFARRGILYVLGGHDSNGQSFREVLSATFEPGKPF
jgi:hypothetical protein